MNWSIEDNILSCILNKPSLLKELFVDDDCFDNHENRLRLLYLKKIYEKYNALDPVVMVQEINDVNKQRSFMEWYNNYLILDSQIASFETYQIKLIEIHKNNLIKKEIDKYSKNLIEMEQLIDSINNINNNNMIISKINKKTPEEMLFMIRNKDKLVEFDKFKYLNRLLKIKKKTINVIAARPSEGKSALALNLFSDLAKKYKCIYFNMEMTEEEVYERLLGIASNIPIEQINKPQTEYQNEKINEFAYQVYNLNYELVNGSKTVKSIKNKIVKESRKEHCIAFIDYTGYIVGKPGQNDRERIGEAVRELNNITKDYDCTIFLIAQINRTGADTPSMQDLKDSGEIEQSADTIILIHDENKDNNDDKKEVNLVVPKCRGGKRNLRIKAIFDKPCQVFSIKEDMWKKY